MNATLRQLLAIGSCALVSLLTADPQLVFSGEFDVYFLGGQSNMEGFGTVSELPKDLRGQQPAAFIFHATATPDQQPVGGAGQWQPLSPGHGTGFVFKDGQPIRSERFGVELSLAAELTNARPGRKIAIIKYARNGSSIAQQAAAHWGCWEPDFEARHGKHRSVNQYDHCLATLRNAWADRDIDEDGEVDQLRPAGIVWMQGESDAAHTPETAAKYEANLKRLMDLLRAALRTDDLPVVIGRISDSGNNPAGKVWAHGDVVREAQRHFVDLDPAARLVTSTDQYGYSDPWHYDSAGYLDLGKQFAAALVELETAASK